MELILAQSSKEFYLEFFFDRDYMGISTNIGKYVNKLTKLKEKYPDDVDIIINPENWIYAKLPVSWFKFPSPKRRVTEEQRQAASERLSQYHLNKKES